MQYESIEFMFDLAHLYFIVLCVVSVSVTVKLIDPEKAPELRFAGFKLSLAATLDTTLKE